MSIITKIKPQFWDHYEAATGQKRAFSFRRKWILMVILTTIVALTPLFIITYIDFKLSMNMLESEAMTHTEKTVSNAWHTISFLLVQRKESLEFVSRDNSYKKLNQSKRLRTVLANLKSEIGGFEDIGVLDDKGIVQAYAGPHNLHGSKMLTSHYQIVVRKGFYIRDVLGKTDTVSRLVIAVKHALPNGSFFILRSSLDSALLHNILSQLEIGEFDDAFIINDRGRLQTTSRFHGSKGAKISLPIPDAKGSGANTMAAIDGNGKAILLGYAHIPDTSLILMIVKPKSEMMGLWYKPRIKLIGFLVLSIGLILVAILSTATYLVNRIHTAHRERMKAVHQVELSNKLASLGRLASGVAHEINNPLAIIDQKAGLIKDLFTMQETYSSDIKLIELIKGVQSSVGRAGSVTKRLLNFARHMETKIERFDLVEVVQDLIALLEKEAEFKRIGINLKTPMAGIEIESDQGNLQQIFLNIINNAFAAMQDGGTLDICIEDHKEGLITIIVTDSGNGIPSDDLKHIFEPFYTAHASQNSTGLGLSITYGLLQEIGGDIAVESKLGQGTRFIITLPLKLISTQRQNTTQYTP